MRALVAFAALACFAAAPAAAEEREFQVPPELTDPAMTDQLGKMLGILSKAMMDMPVGELQAAVEGREPTAADKQRKLRDLAGGDADLAKTVEQKAGEVLPRMQAGMKAIAESLPGLTKSLEGAAERMEGGIDRATANLPTPGYPKR